MVAKMSKTSVRPSNELIEERGKRWTEFYKREFDALEWARKFMNDYERKHRKN